MKIQYQKINPEYETKFGKIKKNNHGYMRITTNEKGNKNKLLHRLIYQDFHKCTLLPNAIIHHKDGNKTNNNITNLELMDITKHNQLHNKNKKHTEQSKQNMSKSRKGIKFTEQHKKNLSKAKKGKKLSEIHKKKISKSLKGENSYLYGKYGEKHNRYGIPLSNEHKKKIGEANKKKYARIIKAGISTANKQIYALKYNGKKIKTSYNPQKLFNYFLKEFPLEIIKKPVKEA